MTTITTTARRITRTLNAKRNDGFRLFFDADGQVTTELYGPEAFSPNPGTYAHAFRTYREAGVAGAPLHRFSYREVQQAIDEAAADEATTNDPATQAAVDEMLAEIDAELGR